MNLANDLARLNLVLELVAECASLVSIDDVTRLVGSRLRWILDFDRCELALVSDGQIDLLAMDRADESLCSTEGGVDSAVGRELIKSALRTGAPSSAGRPISRAAYPLGPPERPLGALFVVSAEGSFTHRELRLLQHIGASLGAVLTRMDRENTFEEQRAQATLLEEQARRERIARDEAIAANAAKDAFLAMLGHELRNPLAPILASAALLRREVSGRATSRVEVIERQARQLSRLVSDLLDASRVTSGKVSLRRALVDMRDVASKAAEMARPGMDAKQQVLELRLPATPAVTDGDEARLSQVLSNLLNNASLYSPAGTSVLLEIEHTRGEIWATVVDNGIGMSPITQAHIFDLFVQGEKSQEFAPGGLGLGLGVARALVEAHGGSISGESPGEGQGSQFRVRLPAASSNLPAAASETLLPVIAPTAFLRVLVVDDNADGADAIAEFLRIAGHNVLVAYSPAEALRLAPSFGPQAAVLDIGMPAMSGHQLADALHAALTTLPRMIALSGFGQERDKAKSKQHGFDAHLVKPVDVAELLRILSS